MNIDALRRTWADAGPFGTAVDLAHAAVNRCAPLFLMRTFVLWCSQPSGPIQPLDGRFREEILQEGELLRYARDPRADLDEPFIRTAFARGDRCHAILDGDALASYAWCSARPTHIAPGLIVAFDDRWSYTYKAFTVATHRGQRLHARVTARVLEEAAAQGRDGVFGCVEVNNFASAKSFTRMGAAVGGTLAALRLHGGYRVCGTALSAAHGFELRPCHGCEEGCRDAAAM